MAGEPATAERALRDGYQEIALLKGTGQLVSLLALLARALAMQGRDEEAMEETEKCRKAAGESQRDAQIKWRAIRSLVLARRGQFEVAEGLVGEAVAMSAGWDQIDSKAEVLADQAYVLRLAGKEDGARRAAAEALVLYRQKGNLVGERRVRVLG
jgi:hypothetical protein